MERSYGQGMVRQEDDQTSELQGGIPPGIQARLPEQALGSVAPDVGFEDVDGDGDLDVVVNGPNIAPYWVENTGGADSTSLFAKGIFRSIVPTTMVWGDVDGDGTLDAVVGHMSGAKVFFGDGSWTMMDLGLVLSSPQNIIIEDVNQDGFTDILIRDSREMTLVQSVEGQFGAISMTWPNLGDSSKLAVGDFVLTNSTLEIMTLDAQGVLGMVTNTGGCWKALQPFSLTRVESFELVDVNRDGKLDITVDIDQDHKVWLEGDGTGGVTVHTDEGPQVNPNAGMTTTMTPVEVPPPPPPPPADQTSSLTPVLSAAPPPPPMSGGMAWDAPMFSMAAPVMYYEPPVLKFDFEAAPDTSFEVTSDNTADYSSSYRGMVIDLEFGEAEITYDPYLSYLFGGWFSFGRTVDYWSDTDTVVNAIGSNKSDILYGNEHDNGMTGRKGDDWLFGDDGNDTLEGNSGDDLLFGGSGDDLAAGGRGDDLVFGDRGDDSIYGQQGNDTLSGDRGDDLIIGGDGRDFIMGGRGDDLICGGAGRDTLYGDAGNDTFHYVSATDGNDLIWDFEVGKDEFQFEFGSETLYSVSSQYDGTYDAKGDAFIWEDNNSWSGKLYYDPDVTVTGDETLIASVYTDNPDTELTVDDITVI